MPRNMHNVQRCDQLLSMFHGLCLCVCVCACVCVSVCLLDATTGCAKVVGPVEMLFGVWTGVGPGNHVLGGGLDPSLGKGRFGAPIIGILRPVIVSCDCLTGV